MQKMPRTLLFPDPVGPINLYRCQQNIVAFERVPYAMIISVFKRFVAFSISSAFNAIAKLRIYWIKKGYAIDLHQFFPNEIGP